MNQCSHIAAMRRRRGFTLTELVASIVVLGAMGATGAGLLLTATDGLAQTGTRAELHNQMNVAMLRIVRELQALPVSEDDDTAPAIDAISASAITWEDGSIALSAGDLVLTLDGTSATLLTGVSGFTLAAFDHAGDTLGLPRTGDNCNDIRRISITLVVTQRGVTESLRTRIYIRSMMMSAAEGGS